METPVQNTVLVERKRREALIAAAPNTQDAQRQADLLHLANLGFPGGNRKAAPVPRYVELAPQVEKELAGVTPEQFAAQREAGNLSDTLREAMSVVPEPARNALQLREFSNADHRLIAPANAHPLLLDNCPKFWTMLSDSLNLYDKVTVIAPDRRWVAEYLVTHCGENNADAKLLSVTHIEPEQFDAPSWLPEGYELISLGPEHSMPGYGIRRKKDQFMILSGGGHPFPNVETARRYLKDSALFRKDEVPKYLP